MNHPHDSRLQEFADGELSAVEHRVIAEHVSICDACRTRIGAIRALTQRLQWSSGVAPFRLGQMEHAIHDSRGRVDTPVSGGEARTPAGRTQVRRWLTAAAALLLLGVGYQAGKSRAAHEPPDERVTADAPGTAARIQRAGSAYIAALAEGHSDLGVEVAASTLRGATMEFARLSAASPPTRLTRF